MERSWRVIFSAAQPSVGAAGAPLDGEREGGADDADDADDALFGVTPEEMAADGSAIEALAAMSAAAAAAAVAAAAAARETAKPQLTVAVAAVAEAAAGGLADGEDDSGPDSAFFSIAAAG